MKRSHPKAPTGRTADRPPAVRPGAPAHAGGLDFEAVRELARIASEFDLAEVEADRAGRVRVRRHGDSGGPSVAVLKSPPPITLAPPPPLEAHEPGTLITSPFVGTFYRAPGADAAHFVDVGDTVRKGQVVCIVEAMKLMNEIEAEADGKIAEVLVKNGEQVEYGQSLFRMTRG